METIYREHFEAYPHLTQEEVMTQLQYEGVNLPLEDLEVVYPHRGATTIWVITHTETFMEHVKEAVKRMEAFYRLLHRIEEAQKMHRPTNDDLGTQEGVDEGYREVARKRSQQCQNK